ncbi:MAG: hypothetical protein WCW87_00545 [Candidatus Paceibacterota bacterium]
MKTLMIALLTLTYFLVPCFSMADQVVGNKDVAISKYIIEVDSNLQKIDILDENGPYYKEAQRFISSIYAKTKGMAEVEVTEMYACSYVFQNTAEFPLQILFDSTTGHNIGKVLSGSNEKYRSNNGFLKPGQKLKVVFLAIGKPYTVDLSPSSPFAMCEVDLKFRTANSLGNQPVILHTLHDTRFLWTIDVRLEQGRIEKDSGNIQRLLEKKPEK